MTFYDGRGHLTPAAPEERRWKSVHKSQRSALRLPQKKRQEKICFPSLMLTCFISEAKMYDTKSVGQVFLNVDCLQFILFYTQALLFVLLSCSASGSFTFFPFTSFPDPIYTCKLGTIRAGEREVYNGCSRLYPNIYNSAISAIKTCAPFPPTKSEMLIVKGREKNNADPCCSVRCQESYKPTNSREGRRRKHMFTDFYCTLTRQRRRRRRSASSQRRNE